MDNFMDKLAQKFNAQELIKANSAAEAAENKRLQEQLASYQECLKEMRRLNLTNVEMSDKLNQMLDALNLKMEESLAPQQENDASVQERTEALEALKEQITDYVHKENVKVYRNVQAVVVEELAKQAESYREEIQTMKDRLASLRKINIAALTAGILGSVSGIAVLTLAVLRILRIL